MIVVLLHYNIIIVMIIFIFFCLDVVTHRAVARIIIITSTYKYNVGCIITVIYTLYTVLSINNENPPNSLNIL